MLRDYCLAPSEPQEPTQSPAATAYFARCVNPRPVLIPSGQFISDHPPASTAAFRVGAAALVRRVHSLAQVAFELVRHHGIISVITPIAAICISPTSWSAYLRIYVHPIGFINDISIYKIALGRRKRVSYKRLCRYDIDGASWIAQPGHDNSRG